MIGHVRGRVDRFGIDTDMMFLRSRGGKAVKAGKSPATSLARLWQSNLHAVVKYIYNQFMVERVFGVAGERADARAKEQIEPLLRELAPTETANHCPQLLDRVPMPIERKRHRKPVSRVQWPRDRWD